MKTRVEYGNGTIKVGTFFRDLELKNCLEIFGVRQKQINPFLFYVSRIISPGYEHLSTTQGHKKNKNIFKKSIDKYKSPVVECHCSQ